MRSPCGPAEQDRPLSVASGSPARAAVANGGWSVRGFGSVPTSEHLVAFLEEESLHVLP